MFLLYMKIGLLLECDPGTTLGGSCLRDVKNMETHLINRCKFDKVYAFTTSGRYGSSADQFIDALKQTRIEVEDHPDALVVVLISGHGYTTCDTNGDETDGQDEMISIGSRSIIDDELYSVVSQYECNMVLLSDTCHSGTMFDLPYVSNDDGRTFTNKLHEQKTQLGKVVSLSACSDQQLSMCDIGDVAGFGGSLTVSVLEPDILELIVSTDTASILKGYTLIKDRLLKLNQRCVLSTI